MKLWLAAFLYFGIPIVAGMVLLYVYVVTTGDEYGENLVPIAE
jgi:hypothetical protein